MKSLRAGCVAAALLATVVWAAPAQALEPYQIVRSLQLVQDRIAGGDHAAMPMQQKLLEMIDRQLRTASAADFAKPRNIRAVLIYGMSGGNPVTVDVALSRFPPDSPDLQLAKGIAAHMRGDVSGAMVALDKLDPTTLPPELGAFVALVKGSVLTAEHPAAAIAMFDKARLLGPGTLVEEAALRRTLALTTQQRDEVRFLRAAEQYVRRFLRSPYATLFADALVTGVAALSDKIDLGMVETTIAEMDADRQKAIYLRLARIGAIEGLTDLARLASQKAAGFEADAAGGADARAMLYASLSTVTSENAAAVLAKLRAIDRTRLGPRDQQLLDAALSVASGVVAVPEGAVSASIPVPAPPAETDAAEPLSDRQDATSALERSPAGGPALSADPGARPAEDELAPSIELVGETRRKLEEIDKLLMETQ